MNQSIDLTISIVSGSQPKLTMDCLASLIKSLDGSITTEIYLIDNASPDHIGELAQHDFPQVRVLTNARRKGFGANHNQILAIGAGRYLLILNDDTIVHPGACQNLVATADLHPQAGFFGPRLLNADGSLQRSAFRFPSPFLVLSQAFLLHRALQFIPPFDDYRSWKHDRLRTVDFLTGAALMVRRQVVDQIGQFDEGFFMYCEETDWCWRARDAGWSVLLVPTAEITHFGGQSTIALGPQRSVEFWRSHDYLLKKHYGTIGWLSYKAAMLIKHLPRLGLSKLRKRPQPEQDTETDIVLWASGMLKRPGLAETIVDT